MTTGTLRCRINTEQLSFYMAEYFLYCIINVNTILCIVLLVTLFVLFVC